MSNNSDEKKVSHKGHMWMMAICCGLPIAGFLAIAVIGISMPSLETALILLCPIGMIGMMYFMHRDGCAGSRQDQGSKSASVKGQTGDELPGAGSDSEKQDSSARTGWLKA